MLDIHRDKDSLVQEFAEQILTEKLFKKFKKNRMSYDDFASEKLQDAMNFLLSVKQIRMEFVIFDNSHQKQLKNRQS